MAENLESGQSQGKPGLYFTPFNSFDACANDLRGVSAEIGTERNQGRLTRRHPDFQACQPEEDEKKLDEKGRVANDFHIAVHDPIQGFNSVAFAHRPENADDESEKGCRKRKLDRQPGAF